MSFDFKDLMLAFFVARIAELECELQVMQSQNLDPFKRAALAHKIKLMQDKADKLRQ